MKRRETIIEPADEYGEDYKIEEIVDPTGDEAVVPPIRYEISSYGIDFDVKGLVERLRAGKIYVPEFQRSFVWRMPDSSRFIESLLLGLPVPGVFLAKDFDTQKLFVIDGQQRLRSLQFFYDGVFDPVSSRTGTQRLFRLTNVQAPFNNRLYTELDERDRQVLDDSVIHATVVKQDTPEDEDTSIYHVYERLNSGGRLLHPQEIRTAVFHGVLIEGIRETNQYPQWRTLFGVRSPRLKDEEMILRFLAMYHSLETYDRPMEEFLTRFARKNREMKKATLSRTLNLFKQSMDLLLTSIGERTFRPERNFNAAVFDSVSYGVAKRISSGQKIKDADINVAYKRLLADDGYLQATSRSTADRAFVERRMHAAEKAFAG